MKFIIKKIIRKVSDVSCRLLSKNLSPKTYHLKPNLGFTLLESLVAISILMIAVASPMTISQKGLSSAIHAKNQITASYLAQDAIEYIINKSDNNVAGGSGWLDGIKFPCDADASKNCIVDTSNSTITNCSGVCPFLKNGSLGQIYNHTGPTESPFRRSVTVDEIVAGVEALITVTMYWKDKGTDRTLNFYTRIYNWKS